VWLEGLIGCSSFCLFAGGESEGSIAEGSEYVLVSSVGNLWESEWVSSSEWRNLLVLLVLT
jgi:hypothetical protein